MNNPLEGRSVIVTGAFGTLGVTVAEAVRAAGAMVAAVDRVEQAQAPAFSPGIEPFGGIDLGAPAADAALKSIAETLGGINGLVNVVGGFRWETIGEGSIDTWDFLYNINLRTAVCAAKWALPHLLQRAASGGGGRIINIGAGAGSNAVLGMGAYAASKSGVARLTEALAAELKDRGITVNAIQPSIIDTPVNRADMPSADFSRWVKPQQIADVIVFMLSDKAEAITGALIPVFGRI